MMNLYGGQGMGTAGTGVNTGGSGMGLQQLLAMMSAGQGGQGGTPAMAPNMASPMAPGNAQTPMSNYIGAPQGMAGGMQHPAMPPVAGNPPPVAPGAAAGGQNPMQMMQMLAAMKGGQSGLAPQGTPSGGTPIPGMPNTGGAGSMMPAWLQAMMHSGSYGATGMGMAPSGTGMQGGGT